MRSCIALVILVALTAKSFASESLTLVGMHVRLGYDLHEPNLVCNLPKELLRANYRDTLYLSTDQPKVNNKFELQITTLAEKLPKLQFEWKGKLTVKVRRGYISVLYSKKF